MMIEQIKTVLRTVNITALLLVTLIVAILVSCSDDKWPTFPGRSEGENNWELLFSWENWGDPIYYFILPDWSPDCSDVCFSFREDRINGSDQYLYIYDITSGEFREIPNTAPRPYGANWSPDGEWIVYNSATDLSVWIVKPDGTDNTPIYGSQVRPGSTALGGDWSPDGDEIVFTGSDPDPTFPHGLVIADISDLSNITYRSIHSANDEYYNNFGASRWSPGGAFIVFPRQMGEWGPQETCITTPRGEYFDTLIPAGEDYQQFPCGWSPDGRYLLLTIYNSSYWDLWAYEMKTGEFTQLTFNEDNNASIEGANWGINDKIVFDYQTIEYDKGQKEYINYTYIYTVDAPR